MQQEQTEIPKLFHSGKVLRTPRHLKHEQQQQMLATHDEEDKKNNPQKLHIPQEINSEEDYWTFRTNKLIKQRSENCTKKTCLDIYSNVAHSLKTKEPSQNDKENAPIKEDNNNNEVNTQLFKGLVFFFNSIRGSGVNSQYNITKLASIHGANVLPNPSRKRKLTHVIASNLTNSKIERMENKKHISNIHVKYVTPKWLTDSIAQNKILPEASYLLTTNSSSNQQQLFSQTQIKKQW